MLTSGAGEQTPAGGACAAALPTLKPELMFRELARAARIDPPALLRSGIVAGHMTPDATKASFLAFSLAAVALKTFSASISIF